MSCNVRAVGRVFFKESDPPIGGSEKGVRNFNSKNPEFSDPPIGGSGIAGRRPAKK